LKNISRFLLISTFALGFSISFAQSANAETATEIMTKACKGFENYNSGELKAYVSIDEEEDGQKIQENFVIDIKVKRPNKFFANVQGDRVGSIYFDGEKISAVDLKTNFYAQTHIKGNFKELLEATEANNIPTPMLDFLERENCLESLSKVSSGKVLGQLTLNGEPVQHLMFRNEADQIDWQAWVKTSDARYSLKKIVITSTYIPEQPQYQFTILSESLDTKIEDQEFDFFAHDGLTKVALLSDLDEGQMQPFYARPVARRTARRTTRRVVRRNYIRRLPAGCVYAGSVYRCGAVVYRPVIEDGVTVYIVVN
jgi:hypothetical protein